MFGFTAGASALFEQTQYKGHNRHDDEHEEQNLGDPDGSCGDTAKAEQRCDERDDEKDNGVVQHF